MSLKFRNSFLGFNKEDVLKYVYSSKDEISTKTNKISVLEKSLTEKNELINSLEDELKELKATAQRQQKEIDDFRAREATLTKLSASIGKLYLVAKANAKSIISSANENIEMSKKMVENNVEIAQKTNNNLQNVKDELTSTAQHFAATIDRINEQISEANVKIDMNNDDINIKKEQLDLLIATVDNEVGI